MTAFKAFNFSADTMVSYWKRTKTNQSISLPRLLLQTPIIAEPFQKPNFVQFQSITKTNSPSLIWIWLLNSGATRIHSLSSTSLLFRVGANTSVSCNVITEYKSRAAGPPKCISATFIQISKICSILSRVTLDLGVHCTMVLWWIPHNTAANQRRVKLVVS